MKKRLFPATLALVLAACGSSRPPQRDVCDPNPCTEQRKGLCVVEDGNARCLCNAGFIARPDGTCEALTADNCPEHPGDADEPDDCQARARALVDDGQPRNRSIHPVGDYDFFRFDAALNDVYVLTVTATGSLFPRIDVFDQGGQYVAGAEALSSARLGFKARATAPYFARVSHSPIDPSLAVGDYALTLSNAGPDDVGDTPQTATAIAPDVGVPSAPRVFDGDFEYALDEDWYAFSGTANTRYTLAFDGGKLVPTVALYASESATSPEFVTTQASFDFFVPATGTAYLALYPPRGEGPYAFTFFRE